MLSDGLETNFYFISSVHFVHCDVIVLLQEHTILSEIPFSGD